MFARVSLLIALLVLSTPAFPASLPRFTTFGWLSPRPNSPTRPMSTTTSTPE